VNTSGLLRKIYLFVCGVVLGSGSIVKLTRRGRRVVWVLETLVIALVVVVLSSLESVVDWLLHLH
jgi:hypothetical protein